MGDNRTLAKKVNGQCNMKTKILVVLISIHLAMACFHTSQLSTGDKMQQILVKGIQKYDVKSVSAAVVFHDGTMWTGVSGISHDTVAVKRDMLFAVGSITKNMVAALALELAEENVVSLKDPLSKWLPDYPHVDGQITIRQLLNHTSGLYMFWENQTIWDELKRDRTKVWSPEDVLQYIKEPYFPPGAGWRYSNTNYLLLAMIIEKATASKLSVEFKNRFWQPLGIDDAYLSLQENIPNNLAHVYGDNFNSDGSNIDLTFLPRASHESITFGSSGLYTSAKSLAIWCHSLFEGKILQPQSMDEMRQFVKFKPVANMRAYGLGVQLYEKGFACGKEAIGHGGANIGTSVYMVYLPEYHTSIVVMINAFPNRGLDVMTKGLIRIVLEKQGATGVIPYFDFFPIGFCVTGISLSMTIIVISAFRKRKRKKLSKV